MGSYKGVKIPRRYILDKDHNVVAMSYSLDEQEDEASLIQWAQWLEGDNRRVARVQYFDVTISTVFLGLDHGFSNGNPILFETLVSGGEIMDEYMDRYSTWDEAVEGHKRICEQALGITHGQEISQTVPRRTKRPSGPKRKN